MLHRVSSQLYKSTKIGWREQLHSILAELGLKAKAEAELKAFLSDIEYWLKELHNVTLQTLVERIMSKMGFVSRALSSSSPHVSNSMPQDLL